MKIIAYCYSDPGSESTPNWEGWDQKIDHIYQDLGDRQALDQLFQDLQTESVDYLLVHNLAELGDSVLAVSLHLKKLELMGIKVIGLATNQAEQKADLINLLREIKRHHHSRNIRKGHTRNRLKFLPPPGKAPYGYRRGKERYLLDRNAAPIVKDFFEHFLLYGSLRGAVRYLEQKHGLIIAVSTGGRWLTNCVYRGDLKYKNDEIISNTHTAIISRAEAAQIDRVLRRNRRLSPRTASAPRSLAGLVICGECESLMKISKVSSRRQSQEYLYLRPTNCSRMPKCGAIPYQSVLKQSIDRICQDLPNAVAKINLPDPEQMKAKITQEIGTKEEILAQIPNLTLKGIFDPETAELRTYKIRTEISQMQSQLAQLPPVNLREIAQAVSIPQFWLDLSESERRFYFREFIRQIKIIRQAQTWHIQLIFIF